MAIRTSANTYSRGIPKDYNNFFFVAQTNNTVVRPVSLYLRTYNFYNRNVTNSASGRNSLIWNN
jgi:hypothetical protein